MDAMITIPDETIEDLRTGLHCVLGAAAERLGEVTTRAGRECHPEWYDEPLEELQHAITVLDIIGWSGKDQPARVALDARKHRWALLEALDMVLRVADDNLEEMTELMRTESAKRERLAQRIESMGDLAEAINAQAPAPDSRQAGSDQRIEEGQETRRLQRPSPRASGR